MKKMYAINILPLSLCHCFESITNSGPSNLFLSVNLKIVGWSVFGTFINLLKHLTLPIWNQISVTFQRYRIWIYSDSQTFTQDTHGWLQYYKALIPEGDSFVDSSRVNCYVEHKARHWERYPNIEWNYTSKWAEDIQVGFELRPSSAFMGDALAYWAISYLLFLMVDSLVFHLSWSEGLSHHCGWGGWS